MQARQQKCSSNLQHELWWGGVYTVFCWPFFPIKDLWMCGMTPGREDRKKGWGYTLGPGARWRHIKATPTSTGDGGFDQRVQLLVPSDGELQVARRYALHLQVLGRVSSQLQDLEQGPELSAARPGGPERTGPGPTSAVRYSRMAALYTAAVAPTRPWLVVLDFRCLWIRPTGNCSESRETGGGFPHTRGKEKGPRVALPWRRQTPCDRARGHERAARTNLQSGSLGARNSLCLGLPGVFSCFSSGLGKMHTRLLNPWPPREGSARTADCTAGNSERGILNIPTAGS